MKLSSAYTVAVSEAKMKKRQLPDPTQGKNNGFLSESFLCFTFKILLSIFRFQNGRVPLLNF